MNPHYRPTHDRRRFLQTAAFGGASWLTGLARVLARESETAPKGRAPKSVIFLYLAGGPSQLETFDPHPGRRIAGGTRAIDTAAPGVQLAAGLPRLAQQMDSLSLVRSLVSKEGDHERGAYLVRTGYRPLPTEVHPSLGAICCHALPADGTEIPRHISILPGAWPPRGGFLGAQYDAFKIGDPADRVPDVRPVVSGGRIDRRMADLAFTERVFARGREQAVRRTHHLATIHQARRMMDSDQLAAFDIDEEPRSLRQRYGDTPFGRGCLAARRLIEVGVRCVEVTLDGWDSHTNNHAAHAERTAILDPAFAALVADLKERGLWDQTIVLCGGEFGRTPQINRLDGRDHWPHGFSFAIGGGRLRGGQVVGATDPEGSKRVVDPRRVADLHATVLTALDIDIEEEIVTPSGRPIRRSDGRAIGELLIDA